MKAQGLTRAWAVNVDQRRSRRAADRVEGALNAAARLPGVLLPFERTAGDEIQGLLADSGDIVALVTDLARLDAADQLDEPGWRIGIGFGQVENVRVTSTRAARGSAYILARQAVEEAARAPAHVILRTDDPADRPAGHLAESALILLRTVLARRTDKGWEVVDAMAAGQTQAQVAEKLGVSESAVSQRLARAGWREGVRGAELAAVLLAAVQAGPSS